MNEPLRVAITIPTYNRREITLACLKRLQTIDRTGLCVDVIVVDDNSNDGTPEAVAAQFPEVILQIGSGHLWWGGAINMGIKYVLQEQQHDYFMTLNDDVVFSTDFLLRMVKTAQLNQRNIVSGVVCDADQQNTIISAGIYPHGFLNYNFSGFLEGLDISRLPLNLFISEVGSCYATLFPVQAFLNVGLIDTQVFPHHLGDFDFFLRAKRKGYRVIIDPTVLIFTKIGRNYFHNKIIDIKPLQISKLFFDIKSTVNIKTRFFFLVRHTPWGLGVVSFIYFVFRMLAAVLMRLVLPRKTFVRIMKKRVNKVHLQDVE